MLKSLVQLTGYATACALLGAFAVGAGLWVGLALISHELNGAGKSTI